MTFEGLFAAVQAGLSGKDVSAFGHFAAFEFQVTGQAAGVFYVEIRDGRMTVAPYNYNDRSALFIADGDTYQEIFEGKLNPMIAFAVGRLKVQGDLGKAQLITTLL